MDGRSPSRFALQIRFEAARQANVTDLWVQTEGIEIIYFLAYETCCL